MIGMEISSELRRPGRREVVAKTESLGQKQQGGRSQSLNLTSQQDKASFSLQAGLANATKQLRASSED